AALADQCDVSAVATPGARSCPVFVPPGWQRLDLFSPAGVDVPPGHAASPHPQGSQRKGTVMPEDVIVSAARPPIGRAREGSGVPIRPDDLATQMVRAALDKVPALNPHQIDDLILGCGLPGGEQGFNMARVVAVELGYYFLP